MAGGRIFILCLLLIVLGAVVYFRVLPRRQLLEHTILPGEAAVDDGPFSHRAILSEGSFNPIAPAPAAAAAGAAGTALGDPARLVAADDWRARYRPFVTRLQPQAQSPGFYIYPFLDRTPQGVGVCFTYGWRLVGSAALASWTDARLAGAQPAEHYGLPAEGAGPDAPTLESWAQRALADPATAAARYVIFGVYDCQPQTGVFTMEVRLLDRGKPSDGRGTLLATDVTPGRPTRATLLQAQRVAAQTMARRLIELGLCRARPVFAAHGLDYNKELRAVSALLDANDSWAVMDGIDRSLQLAVLFPDASGPLQAAAYGMNELNYMMFVYPAAQPSCYAADYALRAFALAQVAAAIDPGPAMTRLSLALAERWADPAGGLALDAADPLQCGPMTPELEGYRNAMLGAVTAEEDLATLQREPAWQVLRLERDQTADAGTSGLRDYLQGRLTAWESHDFYRQGRLRSQSDWHYPAAQAGALASGIDAARMMMRGALAGELAALLATCDRSPAAAALIGQAEQQFEIEPGRLARAAAAGDYYALRATLLSSSLRLWNEPDNADHGYFRTIRSVGRAAAAMGRSPALTRAASGYLGLEFTPAERVELSRRLEPVAPRLVAEQVGLHLHDYAAMVYYMKNYTAACPQNAQGQRDLAALIRRSQAATPQALADRLAADQAAVAAFPLAGAAWDELSVSYLAAGQPERASGARLAAGRIDPDYRASTAATAATTAAAPQPATLWLPASVALGN